MQYDTCKHFSCREECNNAFVYGIAHSKERTSRKGHCATAFSMQSCVESAYQPYADEYH